MICLAGVPGLVRRVRALQDVGGEYGSPVPLDRSRAAILRFYPDVRTTKLKRMYEKNHPLTGLDTASFGRTTETMTDPRHPKK